MHFPIEHDHDVSCTPWLLMVDYTWLALLKERTGYVLVVA